LRLRDRSAGGAQASAARSLGRIGQCGLLGEEDVIGRDGMGMDIFRLE
jgi:hypothetical protein